jgi:ribonuclease D
VTPDHDLVLVETREALVALTDRLAREPRLALDTEANSLHAFRERVCVVQLSAPGVDAIVDPLRVPDLAPLAALVDRDEVEVVFHGGDYDVAMLSREHGFRFRRVFDTMLAATLLGDEKLGLAALVEAAHGVVLSKKFQTANWARRPFTPVHLEYLRGDTRFLLDLHDRLTERLRAADLVEEAAIEFRRLAGRRGVAPVADPEAWRRVKEADRLDAAGRAVLARLWAWRDVRAQAHDVPRFRVLHDEAMLALAKQPPRDAQALAAVPGARAAIAEGDGEALLAAVRAGLEAEARGEAPPAPERPRRTAEDRAVADRVREREERIRRWRTDEATRRRVPNVVVLPNVAMRAMCDAPPASVEAMAAMPDVGPKRAARYGAALLALLADKPATA